MPHSPVRDFGSRDNNFNLLRLIAASAVLVSHAYPLSLGAGTPEPLSASLSVSLGALAVIAFFIISGFFISQSFDNSSSLLGFAVARILRIYPALIAVLLLTTLVIGPLFTRLSPWQFFFNTETFSYIPRNLSLKWLQYGLPGVFDHNPYPQAINGSLWTLVYEVTCYGLVAALGVFGTVNRNWIFGIFFPLYVVAYFAVSTSASLQAFVTNHPFLETLRELSFPFVLGMLIYRGRKFLLPRLSLIVCIGAGIATIVASQTILFREVLILFWGVLLFYVGYLPAKPLRTYNGLGDYSYGMYIYAFPCEQVIVYLWNGISAVTLTAVSLPITLALAVLSWHLVEQPALARKKTATAWLQRCCSAFRSERTIKNEKHLEM
jgi:peptidoglycan/LPS O-acetylase OafA/YrhL